ncbi:unnamed protein product [Adineta ricciae]|uniref:Poly [ADP-ribose] polymerase n=1 Tax=Adineta ricciae TaxID=249248 RepID=A0A815A3N8_ADIRI|nr:unnamed protein product [Adineta ricciae]CAF1253926.1 unnamed protein product [Adineta ricciae]
MHGAKLKAAGFEYLNGLQLNDLYQLEEELSTAWKNGQSIVSNEIYDKVLDSVNYEATQLKADPYSFAMKKTEKELKNLVDFLAQMHAKGTPLVDNSVWDTLNQEWNIRILANSNSSASCPSNWIAMSLNEAPVQLISLPRASQEFHDLSKYFSKSLQKTVVVIHSITRIQNLRLWHIFQELHKTIPNNIQHLIHGTSSPTQQKLIIHHGFYHSFCPNGSIGDGVYFAVNASYSNNDPYVLKRTAHRRELFVCRVLLGNSVKGGFGLKSIPQDFHSVFHRDDAMNDMFCIFNPYQSYPEYIVQYDYV